MTQYQINYKDTLINYKVIIRKIRHIYIRIYPNGDVIVSAPRLASQNQIKNLIIKKASWIIKKLSECQKKNSVLLNNKILFKGDYIPFEISDKSLKNAVIYSNEKFLINSKIKSINKKIDLFLKDETFKYIIENIDKHTETLKVKFKTICVKKIRKFGFCRRNREIVFNQYLITLPERLINYIIFHELTHLIHFNHSKSFNSLILNQFPDKKDLDKKLKTYQLKLY